MQREHEDPIEEFSDEDQTRAPPLAASGRKKWRVGALAPVSAQPLPIPRPRVNPLDLFYEVAVSSAGGCRKWVSWHTVTAECARHGLSPCQASEALQNWMELHMMQREEGAICVLEHPPPTSQEEFHAQDEEAVREQEEAELVAAGAAAAAAEAQVVQMAQQQGAVSAPVGPAASHNAPAPVLAGRIQTRWGRCHVCNRALRPKVNSMTGRPFLSCTGWPRQCQGSCAFPPERYEELPRYWAVRAHGLGR